MSDNVSHSGKELTDMEMVMLGDMLRFYELTATEMGRTLQEEMDGLVAEGNAIANSVDIVGGVLVVAEMVAAMLERGEELKNLGNYVDNSTKFGKVLLAAVDYQNDMLEIMARDVCAHALMAGGCIKCFRIEMRQYLYKELHIDKAIVRMGEGTAAMLQLIAVMGSEADVMSWGAEVFGRYEMLGRKYGASDKIKEWLDKGRDMGDEFVAKMNEKGHPSVDVLIGDVVGRMISVMLLINNGLMESGAYDYLMNGETGAKRESKEISDALNQNISESSIDFLNKIGEKLDD